MHKVKKACLFFGALISFSAYAADIKCPLSQLCKIPSKLNILFFPVEPKIGTNYKCVIAGKGGKVIGVEIAGDGNFNFPTKKITTSKEHQIVEAKFSGAFLMQKPSMIKMVRDADDDVQGYVFCSKN